MRITKYLCLLLVIMAFVMDDGEAKRGGGSSRSSGSRSYSGGSSYRGGSSSGRSGSYYKRTTYQSTTARPVTGYTRIYTGFPGGYHSPYYYDYATRMYWNGSMWYSGMGPPHQGGGAVGVVIVIIILIIICAIVGAAAKNGSMGDGYEETIEIHEEFGNDIPENKFNANAQVFQPGQPRPPNTILCNMGHLMSVSYQHPYPDEPDVPPECDNCQQQINPSMGIFHCSNCGSDNGIDLCAQCGNQRMMQDQMLFQQYQQQQMGGMQMQQPGMMQQPMMQQPMMGQPGMMQTGF